MGDSNYQEMRLEGDQRGDNKKPKIISTSGMYVNPGIHLTPSLADMGQFFSPEMSTSNTRELPNGRRATPLKDKKLKQLIIKQRNLNLSQQSKLDLKFRNKVELSDRFETLNSITTPFTSQ
jgi:hypothetical protein